MRSYCNGAENGNRRLIINTNVKKYLFGHRNRNVIKLAAFSISSIRKRLLADINIRRKYQLGAAIWPAATPAACIK